MKKFFTALLFFILITTLTGCGNVAAGNFGYAAYNVFTADNGAVYQPGDIVYFQTVSADTINIIVSKSVSETNIACVKDKNGNYYAALSDSENGGRYNCFYQIGDTGYPYTDTIEISEYNGVLGHGGFILSFGVGADSKCILYFYIKDGMPVLLAECDKSNYEIDSGDKKNRKLITTYGSVMSQTAIYYNINGRIYKFDMNAFIYNSFCAEGETVSVAYNNTENKFAIYICSKGGANAVFSKEAYINGDTLYIK